MNTECNVMWNDDFINSTFTVSWRNGEYKLHRRTLLFERERAKLPETMEIIQLAQDAKEYVKQHMPPVLERLERRQKRRDAIGLTMSKHQRNIYCFTSLLKEQNDLLRTTEYRLYQVNTIESKSTIEEITKKTKEITDILGESVGRLKEAEETKMAQVQPEYDTLREKIRKTEAIRGRIESLIAKTLENLRSQIPDEELVRRVIYGNEPVSILSRRGDDASASVKVERKKFTFPCPADDCKGFLSQRYKCGVCEKYTCPHCRELKVGGENDPLHKCNPDSVATVEMLKRDTKPCPTCGSAIHRVSGCPQMWCTQCQVAFDWNTGRIETGAVHNPEYFEYVRRTGQEAGNAQRIMNCGQVFNAGQLNRFMTGLITAYNNDGNESREYHKQRDFLLNFMQGIEHLQTVEVRALEADIRNRSGRDTFRYDRVCYLKNELTAELFMKRLQLHERQRSRNTNLLNIYTMYIQAGRDILTRFSAKLQENRAQISDIECTYKEIVNLAKYVNYQCYRYCKNHTSSIAHFTRHGLQVTKINIKDIGAIKSPDDPLP